MNMKLMACAANINNYDDEDGAGGGRASERQVGARQFLTFVYIIFTLFLIWFNANNAQKSKMPRAQKVDDILPMTINNGIQK